MEEKCSHHARLSHGTEAGRVASTMGREGGSLRPMVLFSFADIVPAWPPPNCPATPTGQLLPPSAPTPRPATAQGACQVDFLPNHASVSDLWLPQPGISSFLPSLPAYHSNIIRVSQGGEQVPGVPCSLTLESEIRPRRGGTLSPFQNSLPARVLF